MTPFEIIILILIYCFCFGYANAVLKADNESCRAITLRIVVRFILAFYIPMIIGIQIADKLND